MIRVIKLALLSFIFLFGLITLISLGIPSHIRISKAVDLRGRRDAVFALIQDTAQWKQWHPAFMPQKNRAPALPQTLHIKKETVTDSSVIMQFSQGNKTMYNGWQLYHFPSTSSLTLQWYMDFNLPWYPWQKFSSLFFEDTYGKMMEQGLMNIKKEVESPSPLSPFRGT